MSLSLNFPTTNPSLMIDFVNRSTLDSRVTFTRASSATYFDSSGVITTAAANVPRFDYNPSTLQPRGLLIEEQRTNLLTYSADFANAAWTKSEATITSNTIVAPDGTLTGDKLVDNTNNALHLTVQLPTVTANTNYAYTVFVKKGEFSNVRIRYGKSLTPFTRIGIIYNFDTGVITNVDVGTPTNVTVRSATPVGNGWVRLCVAGIFDTTSTDGHVEVTLIDNSGNSTFVGNGVNGTYIWGAQLEAGAFATSYIPTTTTALTRNADVASMTGTNFSSWYNATNGSLFVTCVNTGNLGFNAPRPASMSNGTNNNLIEFFGSTATAMGFQVNDGGVTQANIAQTANSFTANKLAGAYAANDFAVSINGAAVGTDASGTVPTVDRLQIGNRQDLARPWNGYIQRIAYYPTRLPNAQLQALTL